MIERFKRLDIKIKIALGIVAGGLVAAAGFCIGPVFVKNDSQSILPASETPVGALATQQVLESQMESTALLGTPFATPGTSEELRCNYTGDINLYATPVASGERTELWNLLCMDGYIVTNENYRIDGDPRVYYALLKSGPNGEELDWRVLAK
jgi:hypothetical protein